MPLYGLSFEVRRKRCHTKNSRLGRRVGRRGTAIRVPPRPISWLSDEGRRCDGRCWFRPCAARLSSAAIQVRDGVVAYDTSRRRSLLGNTSLARASICRRAAHAKPAYASAMPAARRLGRQFCARRRLKSAWLITLTRSRIHEVEKANFPVNGRHAERGNCRIVPGRTCIEY